MLIRRLIFSLVNWTIATLVTFGLLLLGGLIVATLDIDLAPERASLIPFWLFITVVATLDSAILWNGFLGAKFSGLRVYSTTNKFLSLIGTFVRASIYILITSLFAWPLYEDALNSSGFLLSPLLSRPWWITYSTIALVVPCSLVITRGFLGIHDMILGIHVKPVTLKQNNVVFDPKAIVFGSLVLALISSIVINSVLIDAGLVKTSKWIMQDISSITHGSIKGEKQRVDESEEYFKSLQTHFRELGFRVSAVGAFVQQDHLRFGLPENGIFITTNDLFLSDDWMARISRAVKIRLEFMGVYEKPPLLVRISKRIYFPGLEIDSNHIFLVYKDHVSREVTGFSGGPLLALCCGQEKLYHSGL